MKYTGMQFSFFYAIMLDPSLRNIITSAGNQV